MMAGIPIEVILPFLLGLVVLINNVQAKRRVQPLASFGMWAAFIGASTFVVGGAEGIPIPHSTLYAAILSPLAGVILTVVTQATIAIRNDTEPRA